MSATGLQPQEELLTIRPLEAEFEVRQAVTRWAKVPGALGVMGSSENAKGLLPHLEEHGIAVFRLHLKAKHIPVEPTLRLEVIGNQDNGVEAEYTSAALTVT